jgi:hypothetical protein
MIRKKRGKGGKRKSSMGKRELKKNIRDLTKMVTKQGKMLERFMKKTTTSKLPKQGAKPFPGGKKKAPKKKGKK